MKNRLVRKIVTTLFTATLGAALLTGCGAASQTQTSDAAADSADKVYRTLDEIKESGTVNIGV